jgi:DNA-binding SARP family transcriptional activator
MTTHRIFVLGPPRLLVDEQIAEPLPAKALALLAYLAVANAAVPRERIVGLLWAESYADAARKNLRNTLWTIRRALGDQAVQAQADRLVLGDDLWVDVREFERRTRDRLPSLGESLEQADRAQQLRAAISAYNGPLLDGIALQEAPEFEIWLTATRERLHQAYMQVLHEVAALARSQGEWDAVIAAAQRALLDDPLQEPMHQMLMEALARRGKRAEALRQYDLLRSLLEHELGVVPLSETEALRLAIHDGALLPAAEQVTAPAARPIRDSRVPVPGERPPLPFIGRDPELAALDAALAASLNKQPRVMLLLGEVGIGKSRLWREWSSRLASDVVVLATRSLSATQGLPFTPLVELFSGAACTQQLFRPGSPVAPLWLAEIARLLPEVRSLLPNLPQPPALQPDEERRRLFEAFVQCLRALNARSLVLFIDDLQWIDQATLDWLAYLLARLHDRSLLLVASYRAEEASPALVRQIAAWRREGLLEQLRLERLTAAEIDALILSLPGGASRVADVRERSGGNPYFAIELLRARPDEVPLALADVVYTRLSRLPEGARQVLQAAAVLEPDVDLAALRRTSGRSDEEVLDALDALLEAALLVERAGEYQFAHPLIATVAATSISRARQIFLHRRAAEAREALAAGRLAPLAGRIAHHYEQAGDLPQAARFAELAADHALALAAPAEAVALLQRALACEASSARQLKLGHALERLGDLPAARAAMEAAVEAFVADGSSFQARRACLDLAYTFLSSGQGDAAIHWAERASAVIGGERDPYADAYTQFLLGAGLQQQGRDVAAAEAHLRSAADIASIHNLPQLRARSRFQLGNLLAEQGELHAAIAAFHETIGLARAAGDLFQEVLAYNNAAYHMVLAGDIQGARELLDMGLALVERHGLRVPLQWLYSTGGELALVEHSWDAAQEWFERGLAEAVQQRNQSQIASYHANLKRVALGRGAAR